MTTLTLWQTALVACAFVVYVGGMVVWFTWTAKRRGNDLMPIVQQDSDYDRT